MLESASNQKVAPSPDNTPPADAKPNTERSGTSSSAQVTVGINFTSQTNLCGPVFGPPPRPLPIGVRPNPGPPPRPLPIGVRPNPGPPPRPLPIGVCPNPGPPPRPLPIGVCPNPGPPPCPIPTLPNPFSNKSNEQLVWAMLANFNVLKGGYFSNSIKLKDIIARALQPLSGNVYQNYLNQLSSEVMSRPALKAAMDNRFSWLRDGRITRQELFELLR